MSTVAPADAAPSSIDPVSGLQFLTYRTRLPRRSSLAGLDLTLAIHERVLAPSTGRLARRRTCAARVRGQAGYETGEGFRLWGSGEPERVRADVANHLRFVTTHDPAVDRVGGSPTEESIT